MGLDKEEFICRINKKEEDAFHDLFRQFHSYLVLFAVRRIGEVEAAEDMVQEVFNV